MILRDSAGAAGRVRVGGTGGYDVRVGSGLLEALPAMVRDVVPARSVALVSDSNVMPLHGAPSADRLEGAGFRVSRHVFEAGEASKTRRTWVRLTDELLEAGHGRDACVVAVGGGVTTDLAGFVAATYLRGIPVVQVPTSYLAMVDASTGGKTGVDVPAGKNLVGAFHRPAVVIADVDALSTLPDRERGEGLVEAVKHGAILDVDHFAFVEAHVAELLDADPAIARRVILDSVALKARVVEQDEFEGGYRQILNFGHTLGHAVEAGSEYELGHGSAVALGMCAEAMMGENLGVTEAGTGARLAELLERLVGPVRTGVTSRAALRFLSADKKVRDGRPRTVLLERIGQVSAGTGWTYAPPEDVTADALERVLSAGLRVAPERS